MQPAENLFAETDLLMGIPSLNDLITLECVPMIAEGWNVSWLGNHIGYLEGSAEGKRIPSFQEYKS